MNKEEWFPLIDEQGNTIGKATRRECHNGSKLLHPVVHLHIINNDGELYLQKRSMNKDIQPGKWDTAVGGHIDYGDTVYTGKIQIDPVEIDDGKFWTFSEIHENMGKGIFTPNFEQEFLRIESRLIRAIKQGTMKKDCE